VSRGRTSSALRSASYIGVVRYQVLAADYDGTLAHHGVLDAETRDALERFRRSGRKVVLVTGRELGDLARVCPDLAVFDVIVAENGAVLHWPPTRETRALCEGPKPAFAEALRARGVSPLSVGHVIVATWEPHQAAVLETIHDMGLELQVIFNKGAVMVLPTGVNKATGLAAALEHLGLSPHNAVGVGDAENDHAFLASCECAVAVANALDGVKAKADLVTRGDHGAGVRELVDRVLGSDLAELAPKLRRHDILLGHRLDAESDGDAAEVRLPAHGANLLVVGHSGGGKTTFTASLLDWMRAAGEPPVVIRTIPGTADRRRHVKKYAAGDVGADRSFYFRGPKGKLNLRAQNLELFLQLADGVDDETWMHHLERGDYSKWVYETIKDEDLAADIEAVERSPSGAPRETRAQVRGAIEARYTKPA